jgi:hypothetical protein
MSHRDEIRWDTSIQEPFILVPVFPDLRVTPTRKGDEADLVGVQPYLIHPLNGCFTR